MPYVSDIKLPKQVPNPLKDMLAEIVEILNNNGYECKEFTSAPTASSAGFEGETRVVRTGATLKVYRYTNGSWWYSGSYTQVT